MIGIIYKYTSPSGKCYIGQTIHEELRKAQHKSAAKDESLKWPFYKAIRKYGWDSMSYEVLVKFECDNRQLLFKILDHFEIFYIAKYNSYKCGYNQTKGGHIVSQEWRTKNESDGFIINADDYEPLPAEFLLKMAEKKNRKLLKQWKKTN